MVNKFPSRIIMLNKMLGSGKLTRDPSAVFQKINIPVPDMSEIEAVTNSTSTATQHQSSSDDKNKSTSQAQAAASNGEAGVSEVRM